jgi:hypothetical protein
MPPAILHRGGNVFTELLSSDDTGIHFTQPLPSDRRDTRTDTETDRTDLWSTPLRRPQVPWYTYCHVTQCDYRPVLDWWSNLLDSLIQRVTTLHNSLLRVITHTLMSTITLLGSGFQRRTSHFFCVPEISPASATSYSRLTHSSNCRLSTNWVGWSMESLLAFASQYLLASVSSKFMIRFSFSPHLLTHTPLWRSA